VPRTGRNQLSWIFAEKQRAEKKHDVWCELTVAEKQRAEKQQAEK